MTGEREEVLILKMSLCVIISVTNVKTFFKRKTFCVIFLKKKTKKRKSKRKKEKKQKKERKSSIYFGIYKYIYLIYTTKKKRKKRKNPNPKFFIKNLNYICTEIHSEVKLKF